MTSLPPGPPSRRRTWAAVAICAAAYLYPFPYHARVNNPNENVRFYMTAAIVEDGTYAIDEIRARWGWVNDTARCPGSPHAYSVKAPGTSLLGVPGYFLYQRYAELRGLVPDRTTALWVVRMTASALPMLVFLFFFHRWLGRQGGPPVVRDAIVLSVGVGSLLYAYATMFVSHTTSAATAFGAFMLLERARRVRAMSAGGALLAGLLAASTTALEYPGFVASALLCLYALTALRPWHRLAPFALGAALPTALVLHFHASAFGDPLTPGHRCLEYDAFRALATQGFFGASELSTDALGGLLFAPAYGLFPLTPVLLLAAIGFPSLLGRRRTRLDAAFALGITVLTYLLICFMNNWRGGWTVGPRYLALTLPFFAWAALEGGRVCALYLRRLTSTMALGAAAAGLVASGAPSAYYPHLPEAFTRPLPQLLRPLVRHDFAPHNAGSWLAAQLGHPWWGSATMVPLAVLGLVSIAWAAWGERRLTDRLLVLLYCPFFASIPLGFLVLDDPAAAGVPDAVAYVVRYWDPPGHDRAAELERRARSDQLDCDGWARLSLTYREEGRLTEAADADRRARSRCAPAAPAPRPSIPGFGLGPLPAPAAPAAPAVRAGATRPPPRP